jgi:hypothetical protein
MQELKLSLVMMVSMWFAMKQVSWVLKQGDSEFCSCYWHQQAQRIADPERVRRPRLLRFQFR